MSEINRFVNEINSLWEDIDFGSTNVDIYNKIKDFSKVNAIFDSIITDKKNYFAYESVAALIMELFESMSKINYSNFTNKLGKIYALETPPEISRGTYVNLEGEEVPYNGITEKPFRTDVFTVFKNLKKTNTEEHIQSEYTIQTASPLFFVSSIRFWKGKDEIYTSSKKLEEIHQKFSDELLDLSLNLDDMERLVYSYCVEKTFRIKACLKIVEKLWLFYRDDFNLINEKKKFKHYKELTKTTATAFLFEYLWKLSEDYVIGREEIIDILYQYFIDGHELSSVIKVFRSTAEISLTFREKTGEIFEAFLSDDTLAKEFIEKELAKNPESSAKIKHKKIIKEVVSINRQKRLMLFEVFKHYAEQLGSSFIDENEQLNFNMENAGKYNKFKSYFLKDLSTNESMLKTDYPYTVSDLYSAFLVIK